MAQLTSKERLQPSLLDRLVAPRSGAGGASAAVTVDSLRESVRRELAALFSAAALDAVEVGLERCPQVQRSSLNFGMSALSGRTASSINLPQLERQLARAIRDFEPRLAAASVRVRSVGETGGKSHNTLRFEIEADLWAQPLSQKLLLRTELDLESGQVRVDESRA
ncbi:MAG TPA: type VI secretion system baseplate subunit TssE [Polyangiaceae bacterium]|nr:type VI secretion system baseplate subunit TssE [Polyangiaceae bacterium]